MPKFEMQFQDHAEMVAVLGPVASALRLAIVLGARERTNLSTYFDQVKGELVDDFKRNWHSEGVSYQAEAQVARKTVDMIYALIEGAKADVVAEGRVIEDTGTDEVAFRGSGPFHLPVLQRATATGHVGNGVTLTMYSTVRTEGGSESKIAAIDAQMITTVAHDLGVALLNAAADSEKK